MTKDSDYSGLPLLKVQVLRALGMGRKAPSPYVAAGSGLAKVLGWLHVVADDELFLASFRAGRKSPGTSRRLFAGELPDDYSERKDAKPDLEAVVHLPRAGGKPGYLLAVPSGSRKNRKKGALIALTATGAASARIQPIRFGALFKTLRRMIDGLNIEGAAYEPARLSLFQRGNAKGSVNMVIELDAQGLLAELLATGKMSSKRIRSLRQYELGTLSGVRLCFTDATVLNGNRWFVAAAEATDDSSEDGEHRGSLLGVITAGGRLVHLGIIDFPHKVEGIAAESEGGRVRLYFVTDADDRKVRSSLLTLVVDDVR